MHIYKKVTHEPGEIIYSFCGVLVVNRQYVRFLKPA